MSVCPSDLRLFPSAADFVCFFAVDLLLAGWLCFDLPDFFFWLLSLVAPFVYQLSVDGRRSRYHHLKYDTVDDLDHQQTLVSSAPHKHTNKHTQHLFIFIAFLFLSNISLTDWFDQKILLLLSDFLFG